MKYDSGGNLQFNKVFSKSDSSDPVSIRFYISGEIVKYDDSHVILTGGIQYSLSKLGVHIFSSIDQLVFKADYDFNIEWASLFDYSSNVDSVSNPVIYNSLIYTASYSANSYPWFYYINGTDGHYITSKVFIYYTSSITSLAGILSLLIYRFENSSNNVTILDMVWFNFIKLN